jgi:transcriptional regulator with XRE-family HTH domain
LAISTKFVHPTVLRFSIGHSLLRQRTAMESVGQIFGRRVRALRQAKKLTQEALGHVAGIDYKHLSAIERGAKTPSFDAIGKLAEALDVECWQLFLPDRRITAGMEQEINAAVAQDGNFSAEDMVEFLKTVRNGVRKLHRRGSAANT